ncbi:MAG: glutamate 5-kinase, partial [Phycisphaeraceae bacterium]
MLTRARRIVVKVGSQLLTDQRGEPDTRMLRRIAHQLAALVERGCEVTLVSSGAVAFGRKTMAIPRRPKDLSVLQAVAAVGQARLMDRWHAAFKQHDIHAAQLLLTRGDFEDRVRYLNIRNCITELHSLGSIPVINENDAVSVDEMRLGDNDVLAAFVTNALCADALVLLTVVDGLQDDDGNVIELVEDVASAQSFVGSHRSTLGTGGMATKLLAARMVTDAGEIAVVANGRTKDILPRLLDGENLGTVFVPAARRLASRQRWIGGAVRPSGVIVIDDGAVRAVAEQNRSLLATGITEVVGNFEKGDVVVIRDARGREIARGLINYPADEARTIMGKRSSQFEKLLGRRAYDEIVHRDNLVTV